MVIFPSAFPIFVAILLASYFKVCILHELDATCGGYTYKINKAMHKYFSPIHKEIEAIDKDIASLKTILLESIKRELELNTKLKEKDILTETESLKNELSTKITMIQILESQIISCENNVTNKDIELSKLNAKLNVFKDPKKYIQNGCNKHSYSLHVVKVKGLLPFIIKCDSEVEGPGWTVIQRRFDGTIDFYQYWDAYMLGFGYVTNEFFLGLRRIHAMTNSERYELYIQLVDQKYEIRFARYDNFVIGGEAENYKLKSLGEYTGNAGDAMRSSEGQYFSTYDRDNDNWEGNCAVSLKGAGWFDRCSDSNLNGERLDCNRENASLTKNTGCTYWYHWHGGSYSMRKTKMMIRPYDYNSDND